MNRSLHFGLFHLSASKRPLGLLLAFTLIVGVVGTWPVAEPRGAESPSESRVIDSSFWSGSLGRHMPLKVYLPPGYESDNASRFPVLYMLHGLGGSHAEWQRQGLFDAATALIRQGDIPPMIIVTPEGESGYWINHAGNGPRYGSYVSRDLVSYIDSAYRTEAKGAARAIGGMSMGGHGALQLALNNPGEFEIVGAHSVALRTKEQAFDFFGDSAYFQAHDPLSIAARDAARARGIKIWIDIGSSDPWFARAQQFHQQLQSQDIDHVWQPWAGGHDGVYWSAHVADYLRYYGSAFTALTNEAVLTAQGQR